MTTNNLEQVERVVELLRNYPFVIREDKLVHPQGSIIISQTEWDGLVKLLVNELSTVRTQANKRLNQECEKRINREVQEARIDENQRRLDKIIAFENRTPKPDELTTANFGSASGAMEVAGFKQSFEERIAELKANPQTNQERK